jgi:hypothetical protein
MDEQQSNLIDVVEADHPMLGNVRIIWSVDEWKIWKAVMGQDFNPVFRKMPRSEFESLKRHKIGWR